MKRIYNMTAEDGTVTAVSKLELVKREIGGFLDGLAKEIEANGKRRVPLDLKIQARVKSRLDEVLWKLERPMSDGNALNTLTADDFYSIYCEYADLCAWIEEKTSMYYTKEKPEFCSYAGITAYAFNELKQSKNVELREIVSDIDTRIANSILLSAENDINKSRASEFRLQAKGGLGHEVTTTRQKDMPAIPLAQVLFTPVQDLATPKIPIGYLENDDDDKTED